MVLVASRGRRLWYDVGGVEGWPSSSGLSAAVWSVVTQPAVVSILLTPLPVSCPSTASPLNYNLALRAFRISGAATDSRPVFTKTTAETDFNHEPSRRPRLATNTTDVVPQVTTPASHQYHRPTQHSSCTCVDTWQ